MSKILPELIVPRVLLRPRPVLPYLWQRILVDGDRGIDASARVAVPGETINTCSTEKCRFEKPEYLPVPNASKLFPSLVDLAFESQLVTKSMHQVHAAKASADNEDIALKIILIGIP